MAATRLGDSIALEDAVVQTAKGFRFGRRHQTRNQATIELIHPGLDAAAKARERRSCFRIRVPQTALPKRTAVSRRRGAAFRSRFSGGGAQGPGKLPRQEG